MKDGMVPGRYVEVSQRFVRPGDVVLLGEGDHVVLRKQHHDSRRYRMTLESMETGRQRKFYVGMNDKAWRFKIYSGLPQRWAMAKGDVIRYPDEQMVAVRHENGWYTSAGRRSLKPDVVILRDVMQGRAEPVRTIDRCDPVCMRGPYLPGTVAAVCDPRTPEPTAWICKEPDLWCSTTQVEASDLMIEMELNRKRYVLLYVPGQG